MTRVKVLSTALVCAAAATIAAQEPAWNAAAIKACDRACLAGIIRYGLGNGWTMNSGR